MDLSIRLGVLLRHEDESGVSGTGIVADVVEFPDGCCVMHWRSNAPSTIIFANLKSLEAVHGHGGKTELVWISDLDSPKTPDEMKELIAEFREEEAEEEDLERRIAAATDEVLEELKESVAEKATESIKRVVRKTKEG